MRSRLWVVLVLVTAGCSEEICDAREGKSTCGYCAEDVVTSSNPHAGMCRYCGPNMTCSGEICGAALRCESRVFLSIPGATFHAGAAPGASGTATAPPVPQVTPSAASVTMGSTHRWTVRWSVAVTITAVIVEVRQLGGYYELPVTTAQSNAGAFELPLVEAAEAPGQSVCLGPTTCYTEAPPATTTGDGTIALVGAGGDVGQPQGGIGITWDRPSYPQSPPTGTGTGGGGGGASGCPTSGAQMGCCTTRSGIQVVGFGLSAPCQCPSDTCPGAGYCGCRACGGC